MRNRKTPLIRPLIPPETPDNSTIHASPSAIPSRSSTPIQPSDPLACETPKKASGESHQSVFSTDYNSAILFKGLRYIGGRSVVILFSLNN
ncbi:unnamed protein product [Larinioides sclopetarius]|uniref:Uncharacterized protein n=1 Tax=Larinioides sclopetarius TaxID=280406 RepID=A0AAV1ZH21_9ARAC